MSVKVTGLLVTASILWTFALVRHDGVRRFVRDQTTIANARPAPVPNQPNLVQSVSGLDPSFSKGKTLVVYGGLCSECSLHSVPPDQIESKAYDKIAFLYLADGEEVKPIQRRYQTKKLSVLTVDDRTVAELGNPDGPAFFLYQKGQFAVSALASDHRPQWVVQR